MEEKKMAIIPNMPEPTSRGGAIPFRDIQVGGAAICTPSDGETLDQIEQKVRNAVASFKKTHKEFNLSVHLREEDVLVYRHATKENEDEDKS